MGRGHLSPSAAKPSEGWLAISPRGGEGNATSRAGGAGKFVEEGVFAVVGGPDGHVEAPGDTALGSFPEQLGIGVFGEFIQANVATIDRHGLGVRGESTDGGAVVELDETDFDFIGKAGRAAVLIEAGDFHEIFAVRDDGAGEIVKLSELVAESDVIEGAGIVFGGEEVVALFEAEPFADIFESVGISPADADGFFSQSEGLFALGMNGVFGLDPVDLVGHEAFGQHGVGINFEGWEDSGHGGEWVDGVVLERKQKAESRKQKGDVKRDA